MKYVSSLALILLLASSLFAAERNHAEHVTIARDQWGVPHIYGETDADVAYGLAWVQAEDDFKTVQETLLAARSLQALKKGKDGAILDFVVHFLGSTEIVREEYEKQISPEFKVYLEAFVKGFNDYAALHPKEVLVKKTVPFTVYDVLAGYHMAAALIQYVQRPLKAITGGKYDMLPSHYGSNAFAVNSKKSVSGNPMICVNPHLPFEGFFSWYEAHLVSEEGLNMYGATLIGGCSVFLGTNEYLGWAHTFNKTSQTNTYELKMHPTDKLKYQYDGEWHMLEKRVVKLKVKLKKWLPRIPVKKTTYWSKIGPVLKTKKGRYYAVRYAAQNEIRSTEQWFKMTKAKSLEEFRTLLDMNAVPKFNIVYADREDNIFYISNGAIPVRDENKDWKDPLPGDTSEYVWTEFYKNRELPQTINPDCGYVFNTNNSPFSASCELGNAAQDNYSEWMNFRVNENNRSLRFLELIEQYDKVSFDDALAIKFDKQYPEHGNFYNSIRWFFEVDPNKYPDIADMLTLMQDWDKKILPDNVGPSIFLVTINTIFEARDNNDQMFLTGMKVEEEEMVEALRLGKKYLLKHFGTVNVPIKDLYVLRRGDKEVYLPGFPDVLAANYAKPAKDGKYVAYIGDSFTLMVEYGKDGPIRIESLTAYGSSAKPDSPHYTDQMELFSKQQPKKVTMDKAEIMAGAERIYRPGAAEMTPEKE